MVADIPTKRKEDKFRLLVDSEIVFILETTALVKWKKTISLYVNLKKNQFFNSKVAPLDSFKR